MNRNKQSVVVSVAVSCLFQRLQWRDDSSFRFSFTTGGQYVDVNGERPDNFFRFRYVPARVALTPLGPAIRIC